MFTKADLFLSYDIPDIWQSRSQYNEPDIHSGEKIMAYCSLEVSVIFLDVLFAQKVLVIFPNSALQYNTQNCVIVWRCQDRLEKMM